MTATTDMTRAVETYCDLAANRLLDIAGSVTTTEALAESVDDYAESWQANSHQLMTLFLGDQNHASIHNSGW